MSALPNGYGWYAGLFRARLPVKINTVYLKYISRNVSTHGAILTMNDVATDFRNLIFRLICMS